MSMATGIPTFCSPTKSSIVWYRNPGAEKSGDPAAWQKFILAENLTKNDNVCLAAQDIDGDGKCEIAVGAEWNPGDTVNSGAVFYLIPPADRTQKWEPVKFPSVEPTTHRMRWLEFEKGKWGLIVLPLHGRGNKNGEGAPVKVLLYQPPTPLNDPQGEWKSEVIDESMHMTHNFEIIRADRITTGITSGGTRTAEVILAGKEGIAIIAKIGARWDRGGPFSFAAGEVRDGEIAHGFSITPVVEPMHGNILAVIMARKAPPHVERHVLTDKLIEGHALGCGDLLGVKSDQIVVGWRGNPPGIHLWTSLDEKGGKWRDSAVDDGGMACEDLVLADVNGDGKLDIIASGRATHNVKVYFNETPR